jgi:SAM-dependent methyltransferase
MILDWGVGRYEKTAAELEPAATSLVKLARLEPGEDVLDLACGSGNVALLAARAGATVTGLDASERLTDVARSRVAAEGLDASFVVGDAQALPFHHDAFDAALSVFGVIFAADAQRAFAEIIRVLRPGGRALLTAWVPGSALDAMVGVFARAVATATGSIEARFPWHDPSAVGELAVYHDATLDCSEHELAFSGESPEVYFAANEAHHPMSVAARPLLEAAGTYEEVRKQALAVLRDRNEDSGRFRITARYRIHVVRPGADERRGHSPQRRDRPGPQRRADRPQIPTQGAVMPLCHVDDHPTKSAEEFQAVMDHLRATGPVPPDGASLLVAGPVDGGWRAISIWDSDESLQQFVAERMRPALQAVGVSPEGTTHSTFQIHTLETADHPIIAEPA